MSLIEASGITHRFGRRTALREVDLAVPEGSIYALLGPNGAGKTTLLRVLMGMLRPDAGRVALLGRERSGLSREERARVTYVAEGQALPGWMRLAELERYLAPLYPGWDAPLADDLRRRFDLDPRQRVATMSRGERTKAALLCALAPRPRLVLMDEPFTGLDVVIKDDLIRGLLDGAGVGGWTVLVSSHDIAELEPVADWVGFLDHGRLTLSEPMETLRSRFRRVEVVSGNGALRLPTPLPPDWLSVEQAGTRLRFVLGNAGTPSLSEELRRWFPGAARIDTHEPSLREIFVALARDGTASRSEEVAG